MDKQVYYFPIDRPLKTFIEYRDNQPFAQYGELNHFKREIDAWDSVKQQVVNCSKLGLGPSDTKVGLPGVVIIYGEQVSPLFTWANKDPQKYTGAVQRQNIVNAVVHFGRDMLHGQGLRELDINNVGEIKYDKGLVEAWYRYKELQTLARAVDNTSAQCRASIDTENSQTAERLRNIYSRTGSYQLQTQDLVSTLIMSTAQKMRETLPLEFTLHIPEFQQRVQENYIEADAKAETPTGYPGKQALESIENALDWLRKTVADEGLCMSESMWNNYKQIHDEIKTTLAKTPTKPLPLQPVFLVEYRDLGKRVNVGVDAKTQLPAFNSSQEVAQYIQGKTNELEQKDPSTAGYFVVFQGYAPKVNQTMSLTEVLLTNTTVSMLNNGIFKQQDCCLMAAIDEQPKRFFTWAAIKDFAEDHDLSHLSIMDYPAMEGETIRKAFEPGGILEHDHITTVIDEQHPELQPLRNIQRILCGEHATWDTVRAAMLIDASYTTNLQDRLNKGESTQDAVRQETLFALKDAAHYTQSYPGMTRNDEQSKIFSDILETHHNDPGKDVASLLEWYADGCIEEFEHQDI